MWGYRTYVYTYLSLVPCLSTRTCGDPDVGKKKISSLFLLDFKMPCMHQCEVPPPLAMAMARPHVRTRAHAHDRGLGIGNYE
ncbi:hypothetical protein DFH27DRAFT_578583 [Peziza echinospora]|nr:hypothetical protein DFH27DRAFT_578583 [Peziza echinospora]